MRKIGLTQRVEVIKERSERRDALDQAWARLLLSKNLFPVPLPNCVTDVGGLLRELQLDGVILTGGNDLGGPSLAQRKVGDRCSGAADAAPERDSLERALLEVCAERGIPVLGVCRGMQLLVTHYGGRILELPGHLGTRHTITVRSADGLGLGPRESVNSFHRFGVRHEDIGPNLIPLAGAEDNTVEAVAHHTYPQWGIMWHPERAPCDGRAKCLLARVFGGDKP